MNRNLVLEFVRVTEAAAISAALWTGKGDRKAADHAAVEAMRQEFGKLDIAGTIVIGEGERDEAPMLFIGEKVGAARESSVGVDIAVDPLEGTNLTAVDAPNSLAVLAAAPKGTILHAPDTYMNKIAVGPLARDHVDLDAEPAENVRLVAKALSKDVSDVVVIILQRDRNQKIIDEVRSVGARVRLIGDGDIFGAIAPALPRSGVDMLLGIGAAPEGVIGAAALKTLGGSFQGRLWFRDEADRVRTTEMGFLEDIDAKLSMDDLVRSDDVLFVATGVTEGSLLKGVRRSGDIVETHSIITRSATGTVRFVEAQHDLSRKNV